MKGIIWTDRSVPILLDTKVYNLLFMLPKLIFFDNILTLTIKNIPYLRKVLPCEVLVLENFSHPTI
jgi:hypothetical protein